MDFYITNISKKDIKISDLDVLVKSMTSYNLLSKKSLIKKEDILKSWQNGSLNKKIKDGSIIIKLKAPKIEEKKIEVANKFLNSRVKTAITVTTKEIQELVDLYGNDKNAIDEKMIKEILDSED